MGSLYVRTDSGTKRGFRGITSDKILLLFDERKTFDYFGESLSVLDRRPYV